MRAYCIGQGTQRSACMLSCFGHVRLFATPWTVAHQVPQSRGFSRQECWSGLPYPPPRDLPNPEVERTSLLSPALAGTFFITSTTWEAHSMLCGDLNEKEIQKQCGHMYMNN